MLDFAVWLLKHGTAILLFAMSLCVTAWVVIDEVTHHKYPAFMRGLEKGVVLCLTMLLLVMSISFFMVLISLGQPPY